ICMKCCIHVPQRKLLTFLIIDFPTCGCSILSGVPAEGQPLLDVCASCHVNATCDDKLDGSGKVCNCKYGFVGNGRAFCQDKDECQIGASKICGQHTTCHNTFGSYHCTCSPGYSPSNSMDIFIPNDGTHCQDIDECRITGLCGDGGQCRNLEGSFDCSCQVGYRVHDGAEPFHPMRDKASCKEVDCGAPPALPHSHMLWNERSSMGAEVVYQCNSGYHNVGKGNVSICTAAGLWERPSVLCQEILCGDPPILPHTGQVWNGSSTPGSTMTYYCKTGFYHNEGNSVSLCTVNGYWSKSLSATIFLAKCGPVPFLANSEVVWHNRSVVIHRCVVGHHSWRGSNVSVCSSSGVWQEATLTCIGEYEHSSGRHDRTSEEIQPPINHLSIFNENCLRWKAEKYEEDTEVYKVTYTGSRDYQGSCTDKRKQFLSSKAEQLELCLNLLPVTNYSISITATSARFTASITTNTSLPEFETPLPTLRLRRSPNTLDPISLYQVFVLPVEGIMMFDCSSPASLDSSNNTKPPAEYITAQFNIQRVGTDMNFTVGDGFLYGGFDNTPLESGTNYYIILRAVSQWKTALKSCCVLWAKVRGNSPCAVMLKMVLPTDTFEIRQKKVIKNAKTSIC
uniref:Sushi domain containing 1 n=1 Tax=Stegastes partitus TaxID=144197 RepID=A0A3B4ZGR2_9TELE